MIILERNKAQFLIFIIVFNGDSKVYRNRQNIKLQIESTSVSKSALIFQADRNKNRISCLQIRKLLKLGTLLRDKYFMARFYSIVCTITNQAHNLQVNIMLASCSIISI